VTPNPQRKVVKSYSRDLGELFTAKFYVKRLQNYGNNALYGPFKGFTEGAVHSLPEV